MYSKPKKRLGQNFLFDKNIQQKIISASALGPSDIILEIGAGTGKLTQLIAQKVRQVYALEIDADLLTILRDNLKNCANVKILHQDILKFNFKGTKNKVKVIGNIPYYITSPIIEHLFKYRDKIKVIFLTVQKEFAERIIASPGTKDYGSFSCFVEYYAEPKILFSIKKTSFSPSPKVDSCFLRLNIRKKPAVKVKDEELLFKIIRTSFNQRRKTLRNSLKDIVSAQKLEKFFNKYNIDRNIRPEKLNLKDFANLTDFS